VLSPVALPAVALGWLLCAWLAFGPAVHGQAAVEDGQGLRFRHIGVDEGLAQSTVRAMHQDRRGFLWIGTENGVQRYDGLRFIHFTAGSGVRLVEGSGDSPGTGPEDDLGSPAAGARRGLRHSHVRSLYEDRAGHLWVGTLGGLDRIDPVSLELLPIEPRVLEQTAGFRIDSTAEDAGGRLWLAGDGYGPLYTSDVADE